MTQGKGHSEWCRCYLHRNLEKKTVTAKYKVTYKNQINSTIDVPEAVKKELDSQLTSKNKGMR